MSGASPVTSRPLHLVYKFLSRHHNRTMTRSNVHAALLLLSTALFCASSAFAQIPAALTTDPAPDAVPPPSMVSLAGVPSHGENLLGVFYLAAGAGPHPTL